MRLCYSWHGAPSPRQCRPDLNQKGFELCTLELDLPRFGGSTATVKSIDLAAFMDHTAIDYVLAVRILHAGSVIMTDGVMDISNRPVTSREYKLMLNVDRFKDREQASQVFLSLLGFLVKKERGSVVEEENDEERNEEERRHTSYLDTPERALHQQGFALRLREEDDGEEGFQINLKYRASDRYISAAQDLSSPQEGKTKFEEDILPPFISKFSHSTSIETDTDPELDSMHKVTAIFPGLRELDINDNTPVETVNDFKVLEIVRKLCKLKFDEDPIIKVSLSFWYLTEDEDEWPLVGEFSFDYDVVDNVADENKLEIYPHRVVEGANRLFNALQKQEGWLSPSTTTKTAFALEVL
jgi:hypothetical protein